jgi:hypothetical protein
MQDEHGTEESRCSCALEMCIVVGTEQAVVALSQR